ncbi:MAG TPA: hypothetical protein VD932_03970 [Aquabacterium sp.]|nr:hypothetical protein [Aquabacterium sp.]
MSAQLQDALVLAADLAAQPNTDAELETAITVTGLHLDVAEANLKAIRGTCSLAEYNAAQREFEAVNDRYQDLLRQAGRA